MPPSAHSYKLVGTFSCARIDLRKTRERELATLDERATSSGIAEPYARQKLKARDDTCDHDLSRSWKVELCEKKQGKTKQNTYVYFNR